MKMTLLGDISKFVDNAHGLDVESDLTLCVSASSRASTASSWAGSCQANCHT